MDNKYDSIMLDLETLATDNNAAIISIGAFKFNLKDIDVYSHLLKLDTDRCFYNVINIESLRNKGFTVDINTLLWWLNQDHLVTHIFKQSIVCNSDIEFVLKRFYDFCCDKKDYLLWGNGSTFDNVILRNAFKVCNIEYPINFRNDVCYRTIKKICKDSFYIQHGEKHNALDDAISQAICLQKIIKELNIKI